MMTRNKCIATTILVTLLLALVSCSGNKKVNVEAEVEEILPENIVELRDDQKKLAEIEMGSVEMRTMSGTIKVSGVVAVAPKNLATVCMPMGGFVKSTTLMPGDVVKKGQALAMVENQDFIDIQQNYLEAHNKLDFAEAEFKRHTELFTNDVYSKQNLQKVTSDYKNLKAEVKALEQKLALIGMDPAKLNVENMSRSVAVVAPISGSVRRVNINIGKFVSPTDVMFEIVNSDNLLLELTLFEKDSDRIFAGQKIRFFINNETEHHEAVVYQTGKSITDEKTYKVYATVPDVCKNVLPGMYVNAIIEATSNEVPSLPAEAIVSFDDKDYIFVYEREKEEDGKPFTEYRIVEVQKGVSDGGFTEVMLPEGFDISTAKVVIVGAYNLLSAKKNAGEMAC